LKDQAVGLPVPGTYKTWRKIDPPGWAASANLRPLDDPELDVALARLDRKRHKTNAATAPANEPERIRLNMTYQQKDAAKKLGARWDAAEKVWWLPAGNEVAINSATDLGFLPKT
jgi:Domain of unknown function (DUF5710)